jgi:hypothetical protein
MKVVGLGGPHRVRIRFAPCEIDLLVDILREQRANATLPAADTYGRVRRDDTRAVDDRHDLLRALERLLMQLENQPPDKRGRVVLMGETEVMIDVIHDGGHEALRRLQDPYERYHERPHTATRDALLGAANTAQAWMVTLTSFDQIDQGLDE